MMAGYYDMVAQLDHAVGRVLRTLEETRQADDTLVIMTTDHGELLGDHQMLFKGPLHYDGLLCVPLIIAGAGTNAGRVVSAPVGTVDLVPTILELAHLPIPPHVDGGSLRPFLTGADARREWVLTENDHEMGMTLYLRTLTTEQYVLTRYETMGGIGELYDHPPRPRRVREPLGRSIIRVHPERHARAPRRRREPRTHGACRIPARLA